MKKLVIALSICLVLLLGVCVALQLQGNKPEEPSESMEQTQSVQNFTVTFKVGGEVCNTQTVEEGNIPQSVTVQLEGIRFIRWMDEQGEPAEPFTTAVQKDTCYQAEFYPLLTAHVSYLFADEENYLRPDEALTAGELQQALLELAAEGAMDHYPALPEGDEALSYGELIGILADFFPQSEVEDVFAYEEGDVLTRSAFAKGMNDLLGFEATEVVVQTAETVIPVDVTADREDAVALLEASVDHEVVEQGLCWGEMELPVAYEPGFVNIDGWLYYVQEDHYFLRNDSLGTMTFGADGRYTSGDADLDATVAAILSQMIDANPEMDRLEILREAYDYCHEEFTYRRTYDHPAFGETGWEIDRSKSMFETGKGNCYNFAAIFWALSRGLGYEARAISGTCLKDEQPHSWCIIEIDGADYFFDPEWQYAYHERGVYDKDMFMIPMDKVSYWTYKWEE